VSEPGIQTHGILFLDSGFAHSALLNERPGMTGLGRLPSGFLQVLRYASVSFLLDFWLINSYAILCNGCANGDNSSSEYRWRRNWSRVGTNNDHNA
jgi:hypothetical protein